MLGLIPLALLGGDGSDPVPERPEDKHGWTHGDQWEGDLCMHKPGLQCTEIRGTNKFDLGPPCFNFEEKLLKEFSNFK